MVQQSYFSTDGSQDMIPYIYSLKLWKKIFNETTLAILPPLNVCRHIPIVLFLLLIFTKDLKEGHIIKIQSWIDGEVASFVIQEHHIPAMGVFVLVLIIFYIEVGIDKGVNWYWYFWEIDGSIVSIDVEVPTN